MEDRRRLPLDPVIQRRFRARKLRHTLFTGLTYLGFLVMFAGMLLIYRPEAAGLSDWLKWGLLLSGGIAIGLSGLFTYLGWRCPACNQYLGGDPQPWACPRCGVKFQ